MTRTELVRLVAERTGMDPADAGRAVQALTAAVAAALARGERVRLAGFGTFEARQRMPRTGRHPRTGRPVAVPASRTVRFRPGQTLRAAVNAGRGQADAPPGRGSGSPGHGTRPAG